MSKLVNVKDKLSFHNFLQHVATLASQQINYSNIAKNIGVDHKTIKAWLSISEECSMVSTIVIIQKMSLIYLSKRI